MPENQPGSDSASSALQDMSFFFFWSEHVQDQIRRYTYLRGRKEAEYDMALVALEARFGDADDEVKALLWHVSTEVRRDFVCFLHSHKTLDEARAWLKYYINLDELEQEQPRRWVRRTPGDIYQIIHDKILEGYTLKEWTSQLASDATTLIKLLHKGVGENLLDALANADADTLEDIICHLNRYNMARLRTLLGLSSAPSSPETISNASSN